MKKTKSGTLYIGTSNVVVPGNKQQFPEAFQSSSRLHYYGSIFDTVELNSTFYKVPMSATFAKWMQDVPEHFRFSIKLWKEITHAKNLAFDKNNIDLFLKAAAGMADKAGCLLIQFPGKITFEYYNQVEQILASIKTSPHAATWQIAIEFRSETWYVGETNELLKEYGACIVLHDIPKGKYLDANDTAPVLYQRFHGPAGDYRGSYTDEFLQQKAQQIKSLIKAGKDVYVYFNNTLGNAFDNAKSLEKFCK